MPVQYVTFSVEVTARVDCQMERWDYGVPGSPTFVDPRPDTVRVRGLAIEDISIDAMPEKLQDMLEDLAADVALQKGEWK